MIERFNKNFANSLSGEVLTGEVDLITPAQEEAERLLAKAEVNHKGPINARDLGQFALRKSNNEINKADQSMQLREVNPNSAEVVKSIEEEINLTIKSVYSIDEDDSITHDEFLNRASKIGFDIASMADTESRDKLITALANINEYDYEHSVKLETYLDEFKAKSLSSILESGANQADVLRAWLGRAKDYSRDYVCSNKICKILEHNLPLNEAGANEIRRRALELEETTAVKPSIDDETLNKMSPLNLNLAIDISTISKTGWNMSNMGRLNRQQQSEYLRILAQNVEPTRKRVFSRSVFFYVEAEGVKLSAQELEEICEETNCASLMLGFGLKGVEGINAIDWIERAVAENAQAERESFNGGTVSLITKIVESKKSDGTISEPEYQTLLKEIYHSSKENELFDVIIKGSNYSDDKKSPFLDIIKQSGDSYIDLYRKQCRQERYSLNRLSDVVKWSGDSSVNSAREILNAMLEGNADLAVEKIVFDIEDSDSMPDWFYRDSVMKFTDMNEDELFDFIADKGKASSLAGLVGYDYLSVNRWVINGGINCIVESLDQDDISRSNFLNVVRTINNNNDLIANIEMSEQANQLLNTLHYASICMPFGVTKEGFGLVRDLKQGVLSNEAIEFGINKTGPRGLDQLKAAFRDIIYEVQKVNLSEEIIAKASANTIYRSALGGQYRVGLSGSDRSGSIDEIIETYLNNGPEAKPVRPEFKSVIYNIAKNKSSKGEIVLTQDVSERLEAIITDVNFILASDDREIIFEEIADILDDQRIELSQEIELIDSGADEKYNKLNNDKARLFYRRNASERLAGVLESIELIEAGEANFENLFSRLHTLNDYNVPLRRLAMADVLDGMSNEAKTELTSIDIVTAGVSEIRSVRDFMETLRQAYVFDDRKTDRDYNALTSSGAFNNMIDRYNSDTIRSDSMQVEFIPTRGIGLELSGHVADACWNVLAGSICKKHPNITAVIFKRMSDSPSAQRLIGSALLIETRDTDGNNVLVMRGINPIENQINKMDAESFLAAAEDYCRNAAKAIGYTPAIVSGQRSGGAATNRPALFNIMVDRYDTNINIEDPAATFNQYKIKGITKSLD